jgi:hypothetical protein
MTYNFNTQYGTTVPVSLAFGKYANGHHRIEMIDTTDGFPYATASVSVPGLAQDEVGIKSYSENTGVLEFLVENNIVKQPHRFVESGYIIIPICKMK